MNILFAIQTELAGYTRIKVDPKPDNITCWQAVTLAEDDRSVNIHINIYQLVYILLPLTLSERDIILILDCPSVQTF